MRSLEVDEKEMFEGNGRKGCSDEYRVECFGGGTKGYANHKASEDYTPSIHNMGPRLID